MKTILYLTDLYYNAKGRKYYEEDLFITSKLKDHFNVLIGNPQQAISYIDVADVIVFRNTGSVIGYEKYFKEFLSIVKDSNIPTFNSFDGKADIKGKQYLIDLTIEKYPVIPTIDSLDDLFKLGETDKYIIKIKNGADSIGMEVMTIDEINLLKPTNKLIQPFINFEYEVSFYYIDNKFQYALYAPDKSKRWELVEYKPTENDLKFANKFIQWNNIKTGITRVDACRTSDNSLLLVELEDLNPFLSIELLSDENKNNFLENMVSSIKQLI